MDQVSALRAVVAGDVHALVRLDPHPDALAGAAAEVGTLRLTKSALRKALGTLRSGSIAPVEAQRWASFMKRGVLDFVQGEPPLDIEWEDEDLFAEVLMRMDELRDLIDGTMSGAEIDDHIAQLGDG